MKEVICYMKSCVLSLFSLFFLVKFEDSLCLPSTTIKTNGMASTNMLPHFDLDMPRNLTVTVGRTGFLHCKVEGIGDKDVSWIRKRDLHILTTGTTTYTSDQRFQVIRPENSGNWTLQIKYPQLRDSGIYECQINTEPKLSLSYMFNVIELQARILGSTDLYVKTGSDINLVCKVPQNPDEIGNVYWYKGNEIIEQTTSQGVFSGPTGVSVENEWRDEITSRLKIKEALPVDTGNYTCVPTLAKPCSAYVHIIISEHPAAIQRNLGVKSNAIAAKSVLHMCLLTIPHALLYTIEDVYLGFFKNMKIILFNEIKLE